MEGGHAPPGTADEPLPGQGSTNTHLKKIRDKRKQVGAADQEADKILGRVQTDPSVEASSQSSGSRKGPYYGVREGDRQATARGSQDYYRG